MATKDDASRVLSVSIRTVDGNVQTFDVDSADAHAGFPAAFTTKWDLSPAVVEREWPLVTLWLRDRLASGLSFAMGTDPMVVYQPSGVISRTFRVGVSDAKTRDADALLQRLGNPQTER